MLLLQIVLLGSLLVISECSFGKKRTIFGTSKSSNLHQPGILKEIPSGHHHETLASRDIMNDQPYISTECEDHSIEIYDSTRQTCVLKSGQNCSGIKTNCVSNAECILHDKEEIPKCKCFEGYLENNDGFCEASYGTECNLTSPCYTSAGLICSDEICQCDSPMSEIFDYRMRKCVLIVAKKCDLKNDQCGSFALCKKNPSGKDICQCISGYSKSLDGTCKLDFGEKCGIGWHNESIISGDNFVMGCNKDAGLACRMGVCTCFDPHTLIYDKDSKLCRFSDHTPKYVKCGYLNENRSFGRKNTTYPVRCPKGLECIEDSRYYGCSCDVRVHPHGVRHQEFCLKNHL